MALPIDFAVYAEQSPIRKKLQPGWNVRVFNKTEAQEGSSIRFDAGTGIISLSPGVYHLNGTSIVTYNDLDPYPDGAGWNTKPRPNGGYCRLRYAADAGCGNEKAIVVGSISSANLIPSIVETYLDVPRFTQIVLEHQAGDQVDGIYQEDNSANSTWHVFSRLAIRRVLESSSQYERSSLVRLFDVALESYLAIPRAYQRLYASYLGTALKFTPTSDAGAWISPKDARLARIFERGTLRFGYTEAAPYVYHAGPPNAGLRGTDWELGNALTEIIRQQYAEETAAKGLRAEWVQVTVSAGGDPEAAKFDALYAGLKADRFDLAMSGQADISTDQSSSAQAREVDWTAPTALLHTNILYSGRDGYDLSGLVGSTRSRFIDAVKGWREVIVMCMVNPGPSPTNSAALVAAINAVGGNARLEETTSLAALQDAIAKQTIHFSVGDAVATSWIGSQLGFKGLNLDIAAGTQPLQTAQHVAAFTLPV